ncbi:glycosyltransferase [Marivirga lumbricoides]|uniref:Glycosyltransferase n=1 Tax=Marivirga lumbricoides TaxID=1046115 RepID=A0A2T4DVP1_9BACT|nr:glycosyltransferase [Marivirga lumbricoides]
MKFYSIIIPVYNRPDEIRELLESLTRQTYNKFEVLVIEDGSDKKCEDICASFSDKIYIKYFYKENTGQGFSRNYGYERAKGEYFVVFDSDCIIPSNYFEVVDEFLRDYPFDAYGGPDAALDSFTSTQKAISYSMTSFFTTGGIRGGKLHVGTFRPRSFNMGISRMVYEKTRGYVITRMAEDLEFSIRIEKAGFKIGLIPNAVVYHKRRTDLKQFYKQLFFFGRGRINLYRFYKEELKPVHAFPSVFSLGLIAWLISFFIYSPVFRIGSILVILYCFILFMDSVFKTKSFKVAILSIAASFTQLVAYGMGFLKELITYIKEPKPSSPNK